MGRSSMALPADGIQLALKYRDALTPRFHWTVAQTESIDSGLCRQAELCGIESILRRVDFTRPDPLEWVTRAGLETWKIRFKAACRSVPPAPEFYVEQIGKVASL